MTAVAIAKSPARLAFVHFVRTGIRLSEGMFGAVSAPLEAKFNPYHDPRDGRFTFASSGFPRAARYTGITKQGLRVIEPLSGGGVDRDGRPIREQFPPDPYALTDPASALAHYIGGSGEDRNYYFDNVDTSRVRLSDFPSVMELARTAKPGVYPIIFATGKYNGNFLGLHDASSWATVGGLNLLASGVLEIGKDDRYSFRGSLSAGPDTYDFNKRSGRSLGAEASTAIGRQISGTPFVIHLIGSKAFHAKGKR